MGRDLRRARRRQVDDTILVTDTMTETVIGQLGNLSETGMLMMASSVLPEDALFQLRFNITDATGRETPVEVGAHLLWQDQAGASGQCWSGFRFITVPESCMLLIRSWIDAPGARQS